MNRMILAAGVLIMTAGITSVVHSQESEDDVVTEEASESSRALTLGEVIAWIRDGVPPSEENSNPDLDSDDDDPAHESGPEPSKAEE